MSKRMSATALSRKYWQGIGGLFGVVEQRIPGTFILRDLWHFADAACIHPLYDGTVYLQVTGGSSGHLRERIKKITHDKEIKANVMRVLGAGNTVIVECWARRFVNKRPHFERIAAHIELKAGRLRVCTEGESHKKGGNMAGKKKSKKKKKPAPGAPPPAPATESGS